MNDHSQPTIRIGISSCLLGDRVRFDGSHKRDSFLTHTVGQLVQFVPVCPEVEMGLGVPRATLRLSRHAGDVRLISPATGQDHTEAMREYSRKKIEVLRVQDLCGFVVKKDSPTCGMTRVRVYDRNGVPSRDGRGLFSDELLRAYPELPVEEEGRLRDPGLRENFFERVFAYRRLKSQFSGDWTLASLVEFHTREKFLLLSHHEKLYRKLGRLVAHAREHDRDELERKYQATFMEACSHVATPRRHRNVLEHILGHFKTLLSRAEKSELLEIIGDFARGLIPLVVPVTLLRHHTRRHDLPYLLRQSYLDPHPRELMLRNHV